MTKEKAEVEEEPTAGFYDPLKGEDEETGLIKSKPSQSQVAPQHPLILTSGTQVTYLYPVQQTQVI